MKKLSLLAVVVFCCLGEGSLLVPSAAPGQEPEPNWPPMDSLWLGNPGVWGRVNPEYGAEPSVSFASDLMILSRQAPAHQTILLNGGFQPLLDASQLGADVAVGGRFNMTLMNTNGWDFMFDGLFMDDFDRRRSVDASNGVNLIFYQGLALDPVNTISSSSRLNTGELNVRKRLIPQLGLLAGIRELQLNEDLDFFQASSSNSAYRSQSGNRLFGFQLGAEAVLPARGYGRFFAMGKYGVYNNRFQVSAEALSGGAPIHMKVHDDMTSFVGDFNAGFEVQTVSCMTLRFGYQCLWIQNVALSVDQLNQFNLVTGDGSVHKSNPVFQGGFVGLVFTF